MASKGTCTPEELAVYPRMRQLLKELKNNTMEERV